MKPKAEARGEIVAWDLVVLGKIDACDWPVIARSVSDAIEQDRDSVPRDEEDTLP
jgi:hypothetical protein